MIDKGTIVSAIANYGLKTAMGMFAKEDFDAAVGEMTGGGIKGNSFLNSFTGGQGLTGLLKNQAKKFGINQGLKALTRGSGIMGPGLLLGGAMMLGRAFDPTREGSRNYNPNLQGQIDFVKSLNGYYQTNSGSGLGQYGPNSVLSGQNVKSMFGTNDYGKQLQNTIDHLESIENKTDKQKDLIARAKEEQDNDSWDSFDKDMAAEDNMQEAADITASIATPITQKRPNEGEGGGGKQGNTGNSPGHPSNRAKGGFINGTNRRLHASGGITNVNMNRGQLGEVLHG